MTPSLLGRSKEFSIVHQQGRLVSKTWCFIIVKSLATLGGNHFLFLPAAGRVALSWFRTPFIPGGAEVPVPKLKYTYPYLSKNPNLSLGSVVSAK